MQRRMVILPPIRLRGCKGSQGEPNVLIFLQACAPLSAGTSAVNGSRESTCMMSWHLLCGTSRQHRSNSGGAAGICLSLAGLPTVAQPTGIVDLST